MTTRKLRRRQRRLARQLAIEYLDDNPSASEDAVSAAVASEMDSEYGMAVDPVALMSWIKLIMELLKLWRDRE